MLSLMQFTSLQFVSARHQTCWRSSQRRRVLAQKRSENRDTRYRFNFFPFHGSSFILLSSPRLQQLESCTDVSQRTFKNVGRRKKDVHQVHPAWCLNSARTSARSRRGSLILTDLSWKRFVVFMGEASISSMLNKMMMN